MQNEYNSQPYHKKWDKSVLNTRRWSPLTAAYIFVISHRLPNRSPSCKELCSGMHLMPLNLRWADTARVVKQNYIFHEATAYETFGEWLHRCRERLNQMHQPIATLSPRPCFICVLLFMFTMSFSSKKEINLWRPEGSAHQLLELMKNTLELWVRKSWLLISEG